MDKLRKGDDGRLYYKGWVVGYNVLSEEWVAHKNRRWLQGDSQQSIMMQIDKEENYEYTSWTH